MIKFTKAFGTSGTSLMGYWKGSYDKLVEVFGEPTHYDGGDKVDIEWELKFNYYGERVLVTIYNWKDYDGGLTAMTDPEYTWHIGGMSFKAQAAVEDYLDQLEEAA